MPIQHVLDTSPLPFSAKEFGAMPKAKCVACQQDVPLQLLSLHAEACCPDVEEVHPVWDDDFEDENRGFTECPSATDCPSASVCSTETTDRTTCPICQKEIDIDLVELHASSCGEKLTVTDIGRAGHQTQSVTSISQLIENLKMRIDDSAIFNICITREDLVERGIKQWKRQKKASPKNPLRVTFIGEAGIDNGAPRKEFLTDMMTGIAQRFFEGGNQGKAPKYTLMDLQDQHFKTVGEIFAVSITQGGPPPNFLMEWCYQYLATGEVQHACTESDVSDPELTKLIQEVREADSTSLLDCTERIVACGYNGPIIDRKDDIVRCIILHATVRLQPMLQQISCGLELYGLRPMVQANRALCRELFVPGPLNVVDADFLIGALAPSFSEVGTMRRQREAKVVNYLQDLMSEFEDKEEEEDGITVSRFCQWLTGQGHKPLDEQEFKIIIEFEHDCSTRHGSHTICYPTLNACAQTVTLPVNHMGSYTDFKHLMCDAIRHGFDFSRF